MEAHGRGLRARADRRGPGRDGPPGRAGHGPRAGGDRGLRPLRRPRPDSTPATRSTRSRRARSATPRTPPSSLTPPARRPACRSASCSREEEARYGYLAAINSTTLADGAVADLGGGSLQLVRGGRSPGPGARLVAARRRADDPSGSSPATARPRASSSARCGRTSPTSGGLRAVAGRRGGRPARRPRRHRPDAGRGGRGSGPRRSPSSGSRGSASPLTRWTTSSSAWPSSPPSERSAIAGIKPARADLVLAGAVVLRAVLGGWAGSTRSRRPRRACARASGSSASSSRPTRGPSSTTSATRPW